MAQSGRVLLAAVLVSMVLLYPLGARLERAFTTRDADAVLAAAAALAISATDLADPFLMTAPDPAENGGGRAWFSEPEEVKEIERGTLVTPLGGAPLAAAMDVARASAALRGQVEEAVLREDAPALERLRSERLAAALALAGRM